MATSENPRAGHDSAKFRQRRQQREQDHLQRYLQVAERYEQPAADHYARLRMEHDNLLTAMQQAQKEQFADGLFRLVWALGRPHDGYLSSQGHWAELKQLLEEVIHIAGEQEDSTAEGAFLSDLATMYLWQGESAAAQDGYTAALEKFQANLDHPVAQRGVAAVYHHLGVIAAEHGDLIQARHYYEQAMRWKRVLEDELSYAKTVHQLANLELEQNQMEAAWSLYEESLHISQAHDSEGDIALTTWNLGNLQYRLQNLPAAEQHYLIAKAYFEELNDQRNLAGVLHSLAQLKLDQGNLHGAKELATESKRLKEGLGSQLHLANTYSLLAVIAYAETDFGASENWFLQAIRVAAGQGNGREAHDLRFNLAMLYQDQNRLPEAIGLMKQLIVEKMGWEMEPTQEQALLEHFMARLNGLDEA